MAKGDEEEQVMVVQRGGTVDLVEVDKVQKVKYLRPCFIKKLFWLLRRCGKGQRCVHVKFGFSVERYGGRLWEMV